MDSVLRISLFVAILCHVTFAAIGSINDTPKQSNQQSKKMDTLEAQMGYLEHYHYLGKDCPDASMRQMTKSNPMEAFQKAVRIFQRNAGLPRTGVVDEKTQEAMEAPRCGFPDVLYEDDMKEESDSTGRHRSKRYDVLGPKWVSTDLTYEIVNFPSRSLLSPSEITDLVRDAFDAWSEVTPLVFDELPSSYTGADITIRFASGSHGDNFPFDGPTGELAHVLWNSRASTLSDVPMHCDNDETWDRGNPSSSVYDLYLVILHEIGHTLGLGHSEFSDAIMYYQYQYKTDTSLDIDDVRGIQAIYGPNPGVPGPTADPAPVDPIEPHEFCTDTSIDAIVMYDGYLNVYKGSKWGKARGGGLEGDAPDDISSFLDGNLPDSLDAAMYIPGRRTGYRCGWDQFWNFRCVFTLMEPNFIFFKDDKMYNYTSYSQGTPQYVEEVSISSVFGIDGPIDAAFFGIGNNRIYIIKDNLYWQINMVTYQPYWGYPRDLSAYNSPFKNLGVSSLDAGILGYSGGGNLINYVFKDDRIIGLDVRTGYILYSGSIYSNVYGCDAQNMQRISQGDNDLFQNNNTGNGLEEYIVYIDPNGHVLDEDEISQQASDMEETQKENGQSAVHSVSLLALGIFMFVPFVL